MPRYEYRKLKPLPAAEKSFDAWLQKSGRAVFQP